MFNPIVQYLVVGTALGVGMSSRSWWWTGKPGTLQSVESQRVRHDWMTELNWTGPWNVSSTVQQQAHRGCCCVNRQEELLTGGRRGEGRRLSWRIVSNRMEGMLQFPSHLMEMEFMFTSLKVHNLKVHIRSDQISHSVVSDSLRPHELQHARRPCPSPTPGVHSDSRPSSQWCHPTISSSVAHFYSCVQSFPASGSFQMSQLFISGGQSIGVSASISVLPMNIQDWSPLGWTGWISL